MPTLARKLEMVHRKTTHRSKNRPRIRFFRCAPSVDNIFLGPTLFVRGLRCESACDLLRSGLVASSSVAAGRSLDALLISADVMLWFSVHFDASD